jgi:hypothetical protein
MSTFKNNIPKSYLIAAFNQVNHYLTSLNYMPDLAEISPEVYGAPVIFGGEGDWNPEVDPAAINLIMTKLADEVSVQVFRMNRSGTANTFVERIKDPAETTGSEYGFDALFELIAPELL